ncbi:hypothetical protein OsI_23055 [Oryza sativa Indica Group]|uniref:Uncharacterized protein n=1 Tax=Oryza sativa subsp. indica TaxID=39946 RepID=A2YD60_ORYSI|nr:hypothetical protein OsI_23055 [Oryza sativa Indica Group]
MADKIQHSTDAMPTDLKFSLLEKITDESSGFDWCTRYKIIKGICEGVNYLHNGPQDRILHLDLKPSNILLDKYNVPKIADFGLSRLFGETLSHHTTKRSIGTVGYMPPEYIDKCHITEKFDIFSLGVIIIEIVTGPKERSKRPDMSSQQFIELVHKNWNNRFQQGIPMYTSEEVCGLQLQLKTCIEMGLQCVEAERLKRPTIAEVVSRLNKLDAMIQKISPSLLPPKLPVVPASARGQVRIAKIGQWGGIGGNYRDIEVAPCRLKSLIIGSGGAIYSIGFSYYDDNGKQHKVGPWGGHGANKGIDHTIHLGPSEYLIEISGTVGPFTYAPHGVITSLTLVTTIRTYGPYGELVGNPFHIPMQNKGGSIVGFFARVGWYVDAFGIYVNPNLGATQEDEPAVFKIGPWGGNRGEAHDIDVAPRRLQSVTICSHDYVNSLAFSYSDWSGHHHTTEPWGGLGGDTHTVEFSPSEFLTGFSGTTGHNVVTSLTLITNARSYGPFGQVGGAPFQVPMRNNASIVGFFGRADQYLNAIGVYANPEQEKIEQEDGLTKMGPWGGMGGDAHENDITVAPRRLKSITISCDVVVDSLAFTCTDQNGQQHAAGPWGESGSRIEKIELGPSEFVTAVYGTVGPFGNYSSVITSLRFVTNAGKYGPFGQGIGTHFQAPMHKGSSSIVGFFGRSSSCVESIGFYVVPV